MVCDHQGLVIYINTKYLGLYCDVTILWHFNINCTQMNDYFKHLFTQMIVSNIFLGIQVMWAKRFLLHDKFIINATCFLMLTLPQWRVKTYNKMHVGFRVTMEWGVGKFKRSNISFFWKVFTPQNPKFHHLFH
jgi:hypothetical protein